MSFRSATTTIKKKDSGKKKQLPLGAIHILRHAGVGGGGYTNIVTKRDAKI